MKVVEIVVLVRITPVRVGEAREQLGPVKGGGGSMVGARGGVGGGLLASYNTG